MPSWLENACESTSRLCIECFLFYPYWLDSLSRELFRNCRPKDRYDLIAGSLFCMSKIGLEEFKTLLRTNFYAVLYTCCSLIDSERTLVELYFCEVLFPPLLWPYLFFKVDVNYDFCLRYWYGFSTTWLWVLLDGMLSIFGLFKSIKTYYDCFLLKFVGFCRVRGVISWLSIYVESACDSFMHAICDASCLEESSWYSWWMFCARCTSEVYIGFKGDIMLSFSWTSSWSRVSSTVSGSGALSFNPVTELLEWSCYSIELRERLTWLWWFSSDGGPA